MSPDRAQNDNRPAWTGRFVVADAVERRLEAFALQTLTLHLTGAANGLGLLARFALGRLFVRTAQFHFPEDTFALKLLLERFERLIDVVIANGYMHGRHFSKELNIRKGARFNIRIRGWEALRTDS